MTATALAQLSRPLGLLGVSRPLNTTRTARSCELVTQTQEDVRQFGSAGHHSMLSADMQALLKALKVVTS